MAPIVAANVPLLKPKPDVSSPALAKVIADFLAGQQGTFGVAVKNLATGETALFNADETFDAASLYKLPVMVEAFRQMREGEITFTQQVTVTDQAANGYDDGDPTMDVSSTVQIGAALERMVEASDNTAAHVLLDTLGAWRINQTMAQLGLTQTQILDGVRTSPANMARLLEMIATGQIIDGDSCRMMIDIMLRQEVRDRLPRLLPPEVKVANKTGNLDGVRHDVGIIYGQTGPYVMAVLARDLDDDEEGSSIIAQLSLAVYRYFNGN